MKTIILAGGRGTRLNELTKNIPKPLVKIKDKSIAEYGIESLKKYGLKNFVFTVNHRAQGIKNYFKDGKNLGTKISYIQEKSNRPLGTAGALAFLKEEIKETFIVTASDIAHDINIYKALRFHKKKKAVATICIYINKKSNPKSIVEMNKSNAILNFTERPKEKLKSNTWSNASLYIFEPIIFNYIKKNEQLDFGKDLFPNIIKAGEKIYGYRHYGYFIDLGTKKNINQFVKDLNTNIYRL